jgi:DNA-binding SARP family transcriptional activator
MSAESELRGGLPEIRLLGELAVFRKGKPLPLPASKKTRALLGYLVATARPHGRERLCDLLWEGPDDPRGALRWSLTKLRGVLDDDAHTRLSADRERVSFIAHGAGVDLERVKALAAAGLKTASLDALEEAAGSWAGHFLEGLDLPGCVQFYAWCVAERDQARSLHAAVLNALIDRLQDQPERALKHARAMVTLDPLAESSHAKVIRLLAALGRTRDALAECDRYRRTLEEQIGERPSAELEALRLSLTPRRAEAEPAPVAPRAASTAEGPTLPLVGRTREQEAIHALVDRAGARPNVLLLLGDSGLGKSRLLEELSARAAAGGTKVLHARAFEAEGVRPYGLWVDALRAVPKERLAAQPELKLLFPELGMPSAAPDRTRLFEAVRALLNALAPVVIVLDDLQWVDEGSAALLHFAARADNGQRVMFACAARPGELGDNPAALGVVRALERERCADSLVLTPLDDAHTAALARELSPTVDVGRVLAAAEGNPLFALELTRAQMRGETEPSAGLTRLARDRLDALTEPEQVVLPWAAALGRHFDASVLTKVSGLPAAPLLDGLTRLEQHGVLRAKGGDVYDFSHDLLRQAAYARLSVPRRRLIHRQIADALKLLGDAFAGDVAQHAALAEEHELAASSCVAAGRRCRRLCAWSDAHALSRRGLEHAARLDPVRRLPLEAELLELQRNERHADARAELDKALARVAGEAQERGLDAVAARAYHYRSLLLFYGGDLQGSHHSSGLAAKADGAAWGGLALQGARCLAVLERDMSEVRERLRDVSVDALPGPEQLEYLWARGLLHRFEGEYSRAAVDLERATAHATREEQHWERAMLLLALALAHLESGRTDAALECARRIAPIAERLGDGVEGPAGAAIAALATVAKETSWAALDRALEDIRRADGKAMLATFANLAAERALERNEPDRARALAGEAREAAIAVGQASEKVLSCAMLARLALENGDAGAELAALREACELPTSARSLAAARTVLEKLPSHPKKG